ncbi:DUF378 domain-containing protein [Halobacteriales archaeon Cl-PHB]
MQSEGRIRVNVLDWVSLLLVIVGALNWGLVGLGTLLDANWNLVDLLLGSFPTIEAVVYLLVGLAGLYELYFGYQLYRARAEERTAAERPT